MSPSPTKKKGSNSDLPQSWKPPPKRFAPGHSNNESTHQETDVDNSHSRDVPRQRYEAPVWKPPPRRFAGTLSPTPDRKRYEVMLSNFPQGTSEKEIYDFVSESVIVSALEIGFSREPSTFQVLRGDRKSFGTQATVRFESWTDTVLFLSHPKLTYKGKNVQHKKTKASKKYDIMFSKAKRKQVKASAMCFNLKEEACVYFVDVTSLSLGRPSDLTRESVMMALNQCIAVEGFPRGHIVGAEKIKGLLVELRDPIDVAKAISLDCTRIEGKEVIVRPWLNIENYAETLRRICNEIYSAPIAEAVVKVEEL
jgi:hypothetical protein